ncbi:hypothetical protein [Rhodococcus sp. ARP2]|uniref:hypothetical protein n=1 Tax=Rhodococcus sp. ARP2 TaxID=1661385 RepID=UPI00064B9B9D|nr:hypothetical protein [Rhodococcus sp. ARP2]
MPSDPIETLTADIEIYGIPQQPGMPPMTETYLHVRRRQNGAAGTAVLGLPAYEGAPGPAGPPGAIHKGDRTQSQLEGLATTLGAAEVNWAYRNVETDDQWIWDGDGFVIYANAYGTPGLTGPAPTMHAGQLTINGTPVDGEFGVEVTGTDGDYAVHLHLPEMPEGEPGPPGASGPIFTSVDVAGPAPTASQVLAFNAATGKLNWSTVRTPIEEYVVPPSGFPNVTKLSSDVRHQLTVVTIPPKAYPYRFDFAGGVDCEAKVGHQIDLEIRLGDPVSGPLLGYGKGQDGEGWREVAFRAHSDVAILPGSTDGVIAANTQAVLYVSAVKKAGSSSSWSVRNNLAQLRIRLTGAA